VWNNLGVVQLRRGGGTAETGLATFYFNKAAENDAADPDLFFNLGYGYWAARDMRAAAYWLREAVRRNPADGEAHYVLSAALAAAGEADAGRERELAHRLSSEFAEWEKRSSADAVPKGLERLKTDVSLPMRRPSETVAPGRDQEALVAFYVNRGRRLYQEENDREALSDLNRALFVAPYHAEANLLLGRIHLRGGQVQDAIGSFKISIWSADGAAAHAALAAAYLEAKDLDAAREEARRALALDASSAEANQVLERAGRSDR
jgi:tetratricopeptide (TPR) repeat protein